MLVYRVDKIFVVEKWNTYREKPFWKNFKCKKNKND